MKIIREINWQTVEIELTAHEVWEAFQEQENICDKEDVTSLIYDTYDAADFLETFGITPEQAEANIDRIARKKRDCQDDGLDWLEAAREAIYYWADDIKDEEAAKA